MVWEKFKEITNFNETKNMIGYFADIGGEDSDIKFRKIFNDFIKSVKEKIRYENYGDGLDLLLIKYFVDGSVHKFTPWKRRISNFSNKNKDISYDIFVNEDNFFKQDDKARRNFIVDSTLEAVRAVKTKLEKRIKVDFDRLLQDVENLRKEYVGE